jgi:hypothetical protein
MEAIRGSSPGSRRGKGHNLGVTLAKGATSESRPLLLIAPYDTKCYSDYVWLRESPDLARSRIR